MPVEEEESDGEVAVGKKKSKPKGIPLPCAAKKEVETQGNTSGTIAL